MTALEDRTQAFVRPDGEEKVTGSGRYAADLSLPGQAYAKFRYADHPHARILRIDTSKAKALPGVFAVLTQADLPDVRWGGMVQDRTLLAGDVVRFEGTGGESLGRRGHSKDHRPDLMRLVRCVVIDAEGRPVCTEIMPGNTADVRVLLPVVDRLRGRMHVNKAAVALATKVARIAWLVLTRAGAL